MLKQTQMQAPSFKEFANSITPKGAYAQIEAMLQSGQITQEQVNQAIEMARTFTG